MHPYSQTQRSKHGRNTFIVLSQTVEHALEFVIKLIALLLFATLRCLTYLLHRIHITMSSVVYLTKPYRLVIGILLILTFGFASVVMSNFWLAQRQLQEQTLHAKLPALSQSLQTEIQKELFKMQLATAHIANDAQLQSWLAQEHADFSPIRKTLTSYQNQYHATRSFVIHEKSEDFWSTDSAPYHLNQANPNDAWYFAAKKIPTLPFQGIYLNEQQNSILSLSTYHSVSHNDGQRIGIVGLNYDIEDWKASIKKVRISHASNASIYFVTTQGKWIFGSHNPKDNSKSATEHTHWLKQAPHELQNQLASIHSQSSLHTSLQVGDTTFLIHGSLVPELNWVMIVEEAYQTPVSILNPHLWLTLAWGGLCIVIITYLIFRHFHHWRKKVETVAGNDHLTKLVNRQAFEIIYKQAATDSLRSHETLCVAMLDIDEFKRINKRYGYTMGDHVLQEVANIIRRSLRESDVVCRWQGAQFMILIKNCNLTKATHITDNLRLALENYDFSRTTEITNIPVQMTVSAGVAESNVEANDDNVFERAQTALRQAKNSGKNRVYFSK